MSNTATENTVYLSKALTEARSIDQVLGMINGGGYVEGMEGIDFTPEMLAGQYAYESEADRLRGSSYQFEITRDELQGSLDYLLYEQGADFNDRIALQHAIEIAKANFREEVLEFSAEKWREIYRASIDHEATDAEIDEVAQDFANFWTSYEIVSRFEF